MLEFTWWPILFIIPLPWILRLIIPSKNKQAQSALYFPHIQRVNEVPQTKRRSSLFKLFIATLAWVALVTASARPIWFGEPVSIPSEGRDLMLAVDLSRSMEQQDMLINGAQVDRLRMVKFVMDDFIDRRIGDRLGLILFADTAYLQAPLTFDREIVKQFLRESVIGLVGDSTAIGDAIGLAVKRFTEKEKSNRVLVLLTDGRNTAGNINVEQALELAKTNEVTIYAIGVGSEEQVQNSFFGPRRFNPSRDLDEKTLINLTEQTGGEYFRARNAEELSQIYTLLDILEPIQGSEQTLRPRQELFYFPLAVAVTLVSLLAISPILFMLSRRAKKSLSANSVHSERKNS